MLHVLHHLVCNCAFLVFADEQVVYSGFIRACLRKAAAAEKGADQSGQTESKQ